MTGDIGAPPVRSGRRPGALRVLIIAHDARATGGVNNFLRIMRRQIRQRIDASRFSNGRRHGEQGKLRTLKRLAWDYVRFAILMRRKPFDVIHANPSFDPASMPRELLFVWLATLFNPRAKVMVFYRGWDWKALEAIRRSPLKRALFLATHKHVDRVLLLAQQFKDALVELGVPGEKIHTVSTMFEGEVLRKVLDAAPAKDPNQLIFMSRFLEVKGGRQTLEALAAVLPKHPQAHIVMAGDGPDRKNLEAAAAELGLADRVAFTGYIGGARKMTLLAESSIFLLPTAHPEGMPNAILEAMAAGDVVISTPVGGIPDVLEDGRNGALLPRADVALIAEALDRYLSDPALTKEIQARNQAKAWATWESNIVSNRIADHYEAVARRA